MVPSILSPLTVPIQLKPSTETVDSSIAPKYRPSKKEFLALILTERIASKKAVLLVGFLGV